MGFFVLIPMYLFLFFYMKSRIKEDAESEKPVDLSALKIEQRSGKLTRAQKNVLFAFSVTVFLWIFPGIVSLVGGRNAPLFLWLQEHFPEAIAAIIGAGLLFFLPIDFQRGEFTLSLREAIKIDWGTLLLFGGGLSLGFQMFESGLAEAIGNAFISLGGSSASTTLITLLAVALSVYMTELTSNTASANMIIPIIIAVSNAAGISPLQPVLGSAIGCSFAFMLPVATPPNAIVYGSGMIPLPQMMKHGFWLNIAGILLISLGIGVVASLFNLF